MIYDFFISAINEGRKLLAILLDPDKLQESMLDDLIPKINESSVDVIFIGGSTVPKNATDLLVQHLRKRTSKPLVLFPGHFDQITPLADGVLFLSLLSGRNPEYLVNQQVNAVPYIENTDLEVIPTGYILVDGGKETAVQRVSGTTPIAAENIEKISRTATAGMYMGNKLIYLEAGSGALNPVAAEVIRSVKKKISIPLIVGGGIRSTIALQEAYDNGADIVVIGTAFEENSDLLTKFKKDEHIY
ncbi:geranylgeranylglyceryl/heptaprenylglyceryl phosphate synthase [Lutimonas sp.]|uniref:geranylgeranylglyceryl/heptaprenylglyceryl phosphate synthase n=1 Tax=Lutimonas sp. TaxID=1872403 RepID=UPI003D9B9C1A